MARKRGDVQSPVPPAFLVRMERLLGDQYPGFRGAYDQPPRSGLRVNTLKISAEAFAALAPWPLEPLPWPPGAFLVTSEAQPGAHPYHAAGLYYLQDPAAMVPAALLDPQPGDYVLDLSAAPGGKATHLASLLGGSGLLVANEIHPKRAWDLAENLERWGARNAVILNETPESIARAFPKFFDRVLVDAPCSGEGMFRRSEAARRDWSLELVEGCATRQAGILDAAAAALRPGGILAYVTCTFAPEEDEGSVAAFLAHHREFSLLRAPAHPGFGPGRPDWLAGAGQPQPPERAPGNHPYDDTSRPGRKGADEPSTDDPADLSRAVRLWPHLFPGEGHFIALLAKTENGAMAVGQTSYDYAASHVPHDLSQTMQAESRRNQQGAYGPARAAARSTARQRQARDIARSRFSVFRPLREQYLAFCAEHLMNVPAEERLALVGTYLYHVPPGLEDPELAALRAIHPGWWLGVFKKERFEPSHALALALHPAEAQQNADLAPEGAEIAAYLRGESIRSPGKDGWILVSVSGHSLGWARRVAGVLKSHYPRGLRRY